MCVPHLHIYSCVCARLNSLILVHKHISDLQPVYALPRDAISLQIKDNGGQVHTECTETIPAMQLYHIHTDVEIFLSKNIISLLASAVSSHADILFAV